MLLARACARAAGRVAALLLLGAAAFSRPAAAAPVNTLMAAQRITIQVKRLRGTAVILKGGLQARLLAHTIQWQYVPGTSVSVPYFHLQFAGIPIPNGYTILAERTGTLKLDSKEGYVLNLALLKKRNHVLVTLIDEEGRFEDWNVLITVTLSESAIFVDETCRDYFFKIRELRRTGEANLIYLGCKSGSGPGEVALDVLWGELERIEYRGQVIPAESAIVEVPLDPRHTSTSELAGISRSGDKSIYEIEYQPYVPPPYEVWAGLAFFRTSFTQSNFPATFTQLSTAFLGQFWYRPEDMKLSLMVRGFGSLLSFSQKLDPDQGYQEGSSTDFVDAELRYSVYDKKGWRIDPFFGGWIFFMSVDSRNFGIQRIIDPVLGLVAQKKLTKRDTALATLRFAPLQSYFNPLQFSRDQSYLELEATYVHALRQRNRFFGTLYLGSLNYAPDGLAATHGSYLVLGGGYGW